ncbi:dimethylamine monooxygenase subunit DmmA family protein [Metabacillus schmidteae]|uniref:dimethylamine monooxygenase subunit DmmA family protein n=1 Tax=Metabacillus schmidteae TaxID=2730405 RepID=UPI00158DD1A7|nr:dimethylamine monooxygenase subunit DmmA family protein [Metabacillus schmidteae]
MNTLTCEIIQEYKMFNSVYSAEVKVKEGSFPNEVGISNSMNSLHSLVSYHVISGDEGLYRLYYQSRHESPFIELQFNEDKLPIISKSYKKLLLFIDDFSLIESLALIRYLTTQPFNGYVYLLTEMNNEDNKSLYFQDILGNQFSKISFSHKELNQTLQSQEIGTRLFLVGKWAMVDDIEKIAHEIGFTNEEIVKHGLGEKVDHIFCVKCYQFSIKQDPLQEETTCSHCQIRLDISNHFSKRHNAYLGYIHI